ncbi:RHS repeat domain-containing protein [Facilibium subflavum]|uniref:RHS repeat domain-containing protein n=1 Tax=Facilibium subflavum TaxID=2219058 RepID=UPI000E64BC79|nr:RHS repeat-associated core domain-containing protein [Facilibium subflavum]
MQKKILLVFLSSSLVVAPNYNFAGGKYQYLGMDHAKAKHNVSIKLLYKSSAQKTNALKMDTSDAYKGSEAQNISGNSTQVNPATGVLHLSVPIVQMHGNLSLNLSINYQSDRSGNLGLPIGWRFNIDSISSKEHVVNFKGRNYLIDYGWEDHTHYKSGLKYFNIHGYSFKEMPENTNFPLNYNDKRQYKYLITALDGSHEYFDSTGKLLAQDDRFGNYIQYYYTKPNVGAKNNYLKLICNSNGQNINFIYSENNTLAIEFFDSAHQSHKQVISFTQQGVQSYTDELGLTTYYHYTQRLGQTLLSEVDAPDGLKTDIAYQSLPYIGVDNQQYALNAVKNVIMYDRASGEKLHEAYYEFSAHNYTGFPSYVFSHFQDNLRDNHPNFSYSVTVTEKAVDAQTGNDVLRKTRSVYNGMSQLVEQDLYRENDSPTQPYFKQVYQYDYHGEYKYATHPNSPTSITQMLYDPLHGKYVELARDVYQYNDFGNTISSLHYIYDRTKNIETLESKINQSYDSHYDLLITYEAQYLNPLTQDFDTLSKKNTLSADDKEIIQTDRFYGKDQTPWKTAKYTYNAFGKNTGSTVSWSALGHQGIQTKTVKKQYIYDNQAKTLKVVSIDALNNQSDKIYDLTTGLLLSSVDNLGNKTTYKYDLDGRLTQIMFPNGNMVTYTYKTYSKDGINQKIMRSELGSVSIKTLDAMGRVVTSASNSNPNNSAQIIVNSKVTYDGFGEPVLLEDALGNSKKIDYNDQGLPVKTVDSDGNVSEVRYDYVDNSQTLTVNGILRKKVVYNSDKQPIKIIEYPNSHNPYSPHYEKIETRLYDGAGQLVQVSHSILENNSLKSIDSITVSYNPDGKVSQERFDHNDSSMLITQRYDLTGNVLDKVKSLNTNGQSQSIRSDSFSYDQSGNLIKIIDRAGKIETYQYDADHHKIAQTQHDGHRIYFSYDKNGNLIKKSWEDGQVQHAISYSYDKDNHLVSVSLDGQAIHYQYSVSGQLLSITYPDGKTQTRTYNDLGQLIQEKGVNGDISTYQYYTNGKLKKLTNASHSVIINYSDVERPDENNVYGSVLSETIDNLYTESVNDNGFGQNVRFKTTTLSGDVLEDKTQVFDNDGLITQVKMSSGVQPENPSLNFVKQYAYDDFYRLIDEKASYANKQTETHYHYDVNGNILSKSDNEGNDTVYTYNQVDELTSITKNGSTYYPQYDQNGNQIFDGINTYFQYNTLGQVTDVLTGNTDIHYTYYPTGKLARRQTAGDVKTFYYHDGKISAIDDSNIENNYLMVGDQPIANIAGQKTSYLVNDGKNNNLVMSYIQGDLNFIQSLDFSAYGKINTAGAHSLVHDIQDNSFGYNGGYTDPVSHRSLFGWREYNPATARFSARDDVSVWNRYIIGDNPLEMEDPSGHLPEFPQLPIWVGGVGIGISAILTMTGKITHNKGLTTAGSVLGIVSGVALAYSVIKEGLSEQNQAPKGASLGQEEDEESAKTLLQQIKPERALAIWAGFNVVPAIAQAIFNPQYHSGRAIASLALSLGASFAGALGFIIPEYAPVFGMIDNGTEGLANAILNNNNPNKAQAIMAGLVSGMVAGYLGGKIYAGIASSFGENYSFSWSKVGFSTLYFAGRGLAMEATRSITYDLLTSADFTSKSTLAQLGQNVMVGTGVTSLEGPGAFLMGANGFAVKGFILFEASGALFEQGIPFVEHVWSNEMHN